MSLVTDIHHSKILFEEKNTSFSLRLSGLVISKHVMKMGHLDYMLALQSGEKFQNHLKISSIFFLPRNGNHYPSLSFRILTFPMSNFRFLLTYFYYRCSAMGKFSRDVLALHSSHEISAISCRYHMMSHKA